MSTGWTILYCIILIIVFILSVGLLTQASTLIGASQTDPNLQEAYKITTTIAVVVWVAIGFISFGGILLLLFGGEAIEAESVVAQYQKATTSWGETIGNIIFFIVFILLIVVGVFSAIASVAISRYTGYQNNTSILKAFDDCCYAAAICLGTILLIIGIYIISYFYNRQPEPKTTAVETKPTEKKVVETKSSETKAVELKNMASSEAVKEQVKQEVIKQAVTKTT